MRLAFLCILQLIMSTSAFAQNANDLLIISSGIMQQAMI